MASAPPASMSRPCWPSPRPGSCRPEITTLSPAGGRFPPPTHLRRMNGMSTTPILATTAGEVERAWRQAGWLPGAPHGVPIRVLVDDVAAYCHMECVCCGARRQAVRHWHRRQRMRAQLVSLECGHSTEA
jgi:hypothetical protein